MAFLSLAAGAQTLGCWPLDFSESDAGRQSGASGSGGYEPPVCPGDPVAEPALVRDECGTFVSAKAAPGGNGTKAKPFVSFREAADRGAKRIYACAEVYAETAGVKFDGGVEVFAGFTDCGATGAWRWDEGSQATLNGKADAVALTLSGGDNELRNLDVVAAAAATPGGSSIALVVEGGMLDMKNGALTAQEAQAGTEGDSLPDDSRLNGVPGAPGVGVCSSGAENPGPAGPSKICSTGGTSTGGKGGDGGVLMGGMAQPAGKGANGGPADPAEPSKGLGGAGQGSGSCVAGTTGANGKPGESGAGAPALGELSAAGYSGNPGVDGTTGKPAQGGGGGGGAKGANSITCSGTTLNRVGASGSAGGSGGCGGNLGGGGKAGGSSIALISLDATVTLTAVTLTAGKAGAGGKGGNGQPGGQPGAQGTPGAGQGSALPGCRGGDGGLGGPGGPGGGGQGGHSLGIAFSGTAPTGGTISVEPSNRGLGGPGGTDNTTANQGKGADGIAEPCWDFAKNAACSASASP